MVYAFGSASFLGSTQGLALASPVVGMAQTANGAGYWLVAEDGGVFGYNAPFFGSAASFPHALPAVGMGATADGGGYWIVTDDGAVYSLRERAVLRRPRPTCGSPRSITDLIPTAGGTVTGSSPATAACSPSATPASSARPAACASTRPSCRWRRPPTDSATGSSRATAACSRSASAAFHGSTGGMRLNAPVVGMASANAGAGYWLAAEDGGVFTFGYAQF